MMLSCLNAFVNVKAKPGTPSPTPIPTPNPNLTLHPPSPIAHGPLQSDLRIFFLRKRQMFARQKHRAVNRHGQAPVPAPDHDGA